MATILNFGSFLFCPTPTANLASRTFSSSINFSQSPFATTSIRCRSRPIITPKLRTFCIASSEYDKSGYSSESQQNTPLVVDGNIDLKLPRRSLLVGFTCNSCNERTERLISRLAYERGTVFVQCAGCLQHHKLVDNLSLVVEYDFREDRDTDLSRDQE